ELDSRQNKHSSSSRSSIKPTIDPPFCSAIRPHPSSNHYGRRSVILPPPRYSSMLIQVALRTPSRSSSSISPARRCKRGAVVGRGLTRQKVAKETDLTAGRLDISPTPSQASFTLPSF